MMAGQGKEGDSCQSESQFSGRAVAWKSEGADPQQYHLSSVPISTISDLGVNHRCGFTH